MTTEYPTAISQDIPITDHGIPDGEYSGRWSAYEVTFLAFDSFKIRYRLKMNKGIRGSVDCKVIIRNGGIIVEQA